MNTKHLNWIDFVLLALLVIPTTVLRYQTLEVIFFHIDECFHLVFALKPTLAELFHSLYTVAPQQFPLDYLINHAAVHLTKDIYKLRLIPLAWSVGSIVTCYFLGKIIWCRTFGWMWALLLSNSVLHIYYSQVLRPYSLIIFLTFLFLLTYLKAQESKSWLPPFAIAAFLFQLCYPFSLAFTLIGAAHAFLSKPSNRNHIITLSALTWLIPLVWIIKIGIPLLQHPAFSYEIPSEWLVYFMDKVVIPFGGGNKISTLIFFALFLTGVTMTIRNQPYRSKALFGVSLFIFSGLVIGIAMKNAQLFLEARHFINIFPLFLCFVAVPLAWLGRHLRSAILITFLIIMGSIRPLSAYFANQGKASGIFREYKLFLSNVHAEKDIVIYSNPNFATTFLYFYDFKSFSRISDIQLSNGFNLFKLPEDIFTLCSADPSQATMNRDLFQVIKRQAAENGKKIWLVGSSINYRREEPPFARALGIDPDMMRPVYQDIYLLNLQ